MSCDTLQKVVDHGTAALAEVQKAPAKSDAAAHGVAAIKAITDSAQAVLTEAKAVPDGALAAVSGAARENFIQAVIDLQELALNESLAARDGRQPAFGDGTLLRLLLEYLPMLIELFNQFFGAQPETP